TAQHTPLTHSFNCSNHSSLFLSFLSHNTSTTAIYTLSLHDALPISAYLRWQRDSVLPHKVPGLRGVHVRLRLGDILSDPLRQPRSEEHTSELQSLRHLVCRLLLEKKKNTSSSSSTPARISRSPH